MARLRPSNTQSRAAENDVLSPLLRLRVDKSSTAIPLLRQATYVYLLCSELQQLQLQLAASAGGVPFRMLAVPCSH